ncbi:hypothetical protein TeGR_g11977 [Tetraparma gracilis]|uniref:Uncharacterized protein n=1 Tax=Tetraparma gracilis TaxID=2962635 RepID=A0ABQ6NB94_9STRA|nr:hypothetical protein TeGR_g11977 [Tetraparma gracilis]
MVSPTNRRIGSNRGTRFSFSRGQPGAPGASTPEADAESSAASLPSTPPSGNNQAAERLPQPPSEDASPSQPSPAKDHYKISNSTLFRNHSFHSSAASVPATANTERHNILSSTEIAEILRSPSSEIAKELSSRDQSLHALRRNISHMTNVADRDGKEILALQATVKDLKRHLAQSDSKLKTSQKRESLLVSPTKSRAHTASASFDDLVDTADANSPSAKHKSLSEALSRSSVEIDDLKLQLRSSTEKCALSQSNNAKLHKMFLHEMKTVTELREEVAALEGKVGSGESEVERLNEMIKHIAKENGAEREELESLKRVVENESKNSEYLKLRLDQDRKLAVKEKEKLGDRNKELEGVVVQLEEAMLAIRAEHSKLQQQHQLQTAQGIKLNEIVGRLTAEKFELSSHRKSLETSLKDVTEKHEKAHRNASVHKIAFDKEKQQRQTSIIKLADMMQRTSAKEQQVAKLEAEVMRLVSRNSELEANNELLESRLERADQQNKNKYQSQDATVNELQKAREGQNEALQILMKEKDALEQRLQREANETRKLEEKLDALEGQGEVLVGELNKTKRVRDELQAKVAGMEGTAKRAGVAAEQQMKEKEKRIIKLQDDLTAAGYEIKELKNNDLEATNMKLKDELEVAMGKVDKLVLEKNGLESELQLLAEERKRVNEEIGDRTNESRRLQGLLEEGEETAARGRAELAAWKKKVAVLETGFKGVELDVTKMMQEMPGIDPAGVEEKVLLWAFEKIKLDLGIAALGDDDA